MGERAAFIPARVLARVEDAEVLLTGGDTMTPVMTMLPVAALPARERLPAGCASTRRLNAHGWLTGRASMGTCEPTGDQDFRRRILGLLAPPGPAAPPSTPAGPAGASEACCSSQEVQ